MMSHRHQYNHPHKKHRHNNHHRQLYNYQLHLDQNYFDNQQSVALILRTGGRDFTADDIYYAAGLAAWNSKARASSNVPVDWVSVRRVKKPSGAKPGMVIFTGNKTVYVDPHEK